jgi:hypothetical protein
VSEPVQISRLIERVLHGEIRVPGFQRNFVWEPDRAALLMDSIYKRYPFGSILLWRTRTQLKTEKELGGFSLPGPEQQYPIDYVLDGQQRITSIFATFQTTSDAPPEDPSVWLPIYYDFDAVSDAQESRFAALTELEAKADGARYFPLRSFFAPVEFAALTRDLDPVKLEEIVKVQAIFTGTLIPIETFTEEDRTSVAIVFERVNRLGVKLDTFQLLTAWTWSEDFDLQVKFTELAEEFEDFGFRDVGSDNDLMLKCCAAILKGDPSPTALIDISGADVRANFEVVANALRRAIDFLATNLHVQHLKFLPYAGLLIPLAAYFSERQGASVSNDDRQVLLRWFWRTAFSHRYSGNPSRNVRDDVQDAVNLRLGLPNIMDSVSDEIGPEFYLQRVFNVGSVASKTLILQLAGREPRSFLSGSRIELDVVLSEPNRKEYHHCYPKAFLAREGLELGGISPSALANYAFLNRAENREISDRAPSVYRAQMPADVGQICASQLLPESLFRDDWLVFIEQRANLLAEDARSLMNQGL